MTSSIGWGIVRHLVTLFAGMLGTYGVIQQSGETEAASAIMAVLAIVWSACEKRAALRAQMVAAARATQAGFVAGANSHGATQQGPLT